MSTISKRFYNSLSRSTLSRLFSSTILTPTTKTSVSMDSIKSSNLENKSKCNTIPIFNDEPEMVNVQNTLTGEILGPKGLEPTRYNDWERKGKCVDF